MHTPKREKVAPRRLKKTRARIGRGGPTRAERLKGTSKRCLDRGRWDVRARGDDAHQSIFAGHRVASRHVKAMGGSGDLLALGLWELAADDYAREMELRERTRRSGRTNTHCLRSAIGEMKAAGDRP